MKIRRKSRFHAEVSTSSLNDIMFFLLLFFLIVSTVANPSVIKLMLPKAESHQNVTKKQITLSVNANLEYFIDNKPILFDQLESTLSAALANTEDPTVILRFDNALTIQQLVDVLSLGNKLKIKMVLATAKAE